MPINVKRGKHVSYTIPDEITDNVTPVKKSFLDTLVNAINQNLGEAKGFKQVISGYGNPDNKVNRYYPYERTSEDDRYESSAIINNPLLAKDFNYIISNMNKALSDLYGYDETIGNLEFKAYTQPGNYTFVTPKGCKSVILGVCGAGGGLAEKFDGSESFFEGVIAAGGVGKYTKNALAFTSGYSLSLYEMIDGYYGRPERSISWLKTNTLQYNDVEYNSGEHGEFIHAILNVNENTGYSVKVGRAANPAKYTDINKIPSGGFVYIAYVKGGDKSKYGFDKVYTQPGTYTFTVPGGIKKISVFVVGGGAIYIDKTRYKSTKDFPDGANGEQSGFDTVVAEGGKYKNDKDEVILKEITSSGHNLSFFNEFGTVGRGFINNTYGTSVADDGKVVTKIIDCFPGQQFEVKVGDGGKITLDENGTEYELKANHGAVGVYYGDYNEIDSFNQFRLLAAGDTIGKSLFNNIITNLKAINTVFNNKNNFWDENDLCARSCQVSCQSSCQIACQDCQYYTAHNQNSGGWV